MRSASWFASLSVLAVMPLAAAETAKPAEEQPAWSERIQTVLDVARPLKFPRQGRLPLYLWPATNSADLDDATAANLVEELDRRGVGLVSSWSPRRREESLARALRVGRAQQKLGLRVNVNASGCLHSFFNGDQSTAHSDENGQPFWDESFNSGTAKHKMGCPFALDARKDPIREQTEYFAKAYHSAGVPLDFAFVDWEIDGPIEFNRAHEASKRCTRCRENIPHIDNFLEFQKPLREIRSELQRYALTDPIKSRFGDALIGNYAVYPHNGYRYWYDYFEYFVEGQPHLADQRAKYRLWANDFVGTGFTCALPVAYTWYPTYEWYDFEVSDYRWFYNMLLVASNAGRHAGADVPVITFVHWHTTAPPENPSPEVKQLSERAYQELLWHMLLRGTDTFFLWCPRDEDATEVRLLHEVYAAAQEYGPFLENGTPVCFDVPQQPGTVVSALLLKDRLLVRRTDFAGSSDPVEIAVGNRKVTIEARPGEMQVLSIR
jgi:hypothetical protein